MRPLQLPEGSICEVIHKVFPTGNYMDDFKGVFKAATEIKNTAPGKEPVRGIRLPKLKNAAEMLKVGGDGAGTLNNFYDLVQNLGSFLELMG